jgi:hypothetical protein
VWQNTTTVDVDLVANGDIVTENRDVLQASPLADRRVPADDGALDPGVVLDLATTENDTSLDPHAVADHDVGADGDVWTDAAVLADPGRGVHQDVAAVHERLAVRRKLLAALLRKAGQVQARAGQEVLWLTDVHPEALEVEGVELTVLDESREGLLLDRGGAELNPAEDGGVEDVDAGVDAVANELDGLLDEAVDARGVSRLVDDDTVLGGLLDLCDDDRALLAVRLVEFGELLEGVLAGDVGVEDEEGGVALAENLLSELERTGGAEWLGLEREVNLDVVQLLVL